MVLVVRLVSGAGMTDDRIAETNTNVSWEGLTPIPYLRQSPARAVLDYSFVRFVLSSGRFLVPLVRILHAQNDGAQFEWPTVGYPEPYDFILAHPEQ